jgi:DNA polymerase-3 subunit gamma/tau
LLALARKYRPKNFASVAVQSHVSNTLKGAIARGRVAHGYLLCGPRGTGKTTLARVLAMALNCENRIRAEGSEGAAAGLARAASVDATGSGASHGTFASAAGVDAGASSASHGTFASAAGVDAAGSGASHGTFASAAGEPCGVCESCMRIWRGDASLDVVEIDAASNRGVDDARELRERAMYAPSGDDRYKVYIVDEAHMLTREAWNALLKVLEEPPPRVVFVFATTEPQKIAQAAAPVLSRLQRFDLKRIGASDIRARLATVLEAEQVDAEHDALAMIARAADGSMRDALSLTDQALAMGEGSLTADRVREALGLVPEDEYIALLDIVAERRAGEVFATIGRLAEAGIDFGALLTGFADALRALLALELGGDVPDISDGMRDALAARRGRLSAGDLLRMLNALAELEPRFRKSGQQQLLLETLLVRLALMDRTLALEEVLRGIGSGSAGSIPRETPPRSPADAAPVAPTRQSAPNGPPAATKAVTKAALPDAPPRAANASLPDAPAAVPVEVEDPRDAIGAPTAQLPVIDANALTGRWDDIVAHVRSHGRNLLAAALGETVPVGVSASGVITLQLDAPDEIRTQALEAGKIDILEAIRAFFTGAERVNVRANAAPRSAAPAQRITDESVRADRVTALRKKDPILGAAVDALDLDLLD